MNDDEEVIETSDTDERDTLCTTDHRYWQQAAFEFRTRRPQSRPSPRKRVKLDHQSSANRRDSSSPQLELDLKLSPLVPDACPSSPSDDLNISLSSHSPKSSSLVPTPKDAGDDDVHTTQEASSWDVTLESYDNSQNPLDMFMTQGRSLNEFTQGKTTKTVAGSRVLKPFNDEVPIEPSHSPSRSRSHSIDPLYLFTSPSSNSKLATTTRLSESPVNIPATPPTIIDLDNTASFTPQNNNNLDDENILTLTPQRQASQSSRYQSLTPPPPGQKPPSTDSPHSSPLSLPPSPIPLPPNPNPNAHLQNQDLAIAQNFANDPDTRRYTMRERRPQQLHPYIHDQLMYKRQMRSNPEAIVKFGVRVGSPTKGRSRSRGSGEEEAEAEIQGGGGEEETQQWRMDIDGEQEEEEEEDSWADRRRKRNRSRSKSVDASSNRNRKSNPPHAPPAWLPEALQHLSSSSDDEEERDVKDLLNEAKKVKERARRRERELAKEREREERQEREKEGRKRRVKPFPMRKERERKMDEEVEERYPSPESHDIPQLPHTPARSRSPKSRLKSNSPTISIHSTPSQRHLPTAQALDDNPVDYDFGGDGADYDQDDNVWIGHADGGTDFQFKSPVQSQPQPSNSQRPRRQSPAGDAEEERDKITSYSHSHNSNSSDAGDPSSDSDSSSNEMTSKDRKRLKALQRMMPAAMARQLVQKAQQQKAKALANSKRQRSATASDDDDDGDRDAEEGPLLPGKTRVRIGQRKGDVDIKGDTESEDSEPSSLPPVHPDSDVEIVRPSVASSHVTYINGIEEESNRSSSDDDEVDDAKIDAWLGDRSRSGDAGVGHPPRLREESLVDWMLTRTRTIGPGKTGERKQKKSMRRTGEPRAPSGGQGRLHVVTAGAQKERQTLLSFDKQSKTKHSRSSGGGHRSRAPRRLPVEDDVHMDDYDRDLDAEPAVNKYWVDSAKSATAKKAKKKRPGPQVYIFTSKGTHITSGRRRLESAITIDVEDEGFHQALAPEGTHRPPARRKAKPKPMGGRDYHNGAAIVDVPMDIEVDYEPPPRRHDLQNSFEHRRDIKLDFDIHFLPSGLAFKPHTYIGKGWLHELVTLVSGTGDIVVPNSYAAHDIELGPATSPSDLATSLVSVGDGLLKFAFGPSENQTVENVNLWEGILRTLCQLLSWLPAHSNVEECTLLANALQEQLLMLITYIDDREDAFSEDGTPSNSMVLTIYWFAIESLVRFSCSMQKSQPELIFDAQNLIKYISLLARRLHNYGMQRMLEPILTDSDGLDTMFIPERTAELWVCLFHLLSNCHVPTSNDPNLGQHHPFWRIVQLTLQQDDRPSHAGLEASETTWRTIFSICALSQFSVHGMRTSTCRLPASWELVAFALKQIRLVADPQTEKLLSERILDKRDEYIWLVASRCFILCNRWHWRIDDASMMFNQLASIFRSRKFANLRREASDFPSFMLKSDFQLLSQYKPSDTAFELFLKLIVQALNDCHPADEGNAHHVSSKLKKLLALAVPVGSVPFTKSTPPTVHELSMLYNRLSAVAVAIYLESSPASVNKRLTNARRYVNFKDADDTTRVACIRGMMHFSIIMRYRRLPLDDVLSWLAEMTDILVDEYRDIDAPANKLNGNQPSNVARQRAMFSIQVLLGSVRRIIETSNIDPTQPQKQYPEPALLNGPWVTRIFAASTNLTHAGKTGLEIRRLVQAFLDARQAAMPAAQHHPVVIPVGDQESQESQEDYGAFDLDLNDPELQAALGDDVELSAANQNKAKDELVWQVIANHISPAIFRLVCKHFNDPSDTISFEEYCQDADKWIDCWVGCANVLVQLGKTKWDTFLELGSMSWEKIIEASWRRRVGLRFMFMLLRFDPEAYTTRNDLFVKVLLESIVAAKVTMENEYMSLFFSIDRHRYPLLRHVPCQPPLQASDYVISVPEFLALRLPTVHTVFSNLADCLRKEAYGKDNAGRSQTYVGHVVTMLSTMQDVCDQMTEGSDERTTYSAFCRDVFSCLRQHAELKAQQRLGASIAWGQTLGAT